jgi:hypothetical protein
MVSKLTLFIASEPRLFKQSNANKLEFYVWDSRAGYKLVMSQGMKDLVNIETGYIYEFYNVWI